MNAMLAPYRVVVPTDEARALAHDRLLALRKEGLDPNGVMQYAFHLVSYYDYRQLSQWVGQDLIAVKPELAQAAGHYRQVLHNCLDAIGEVAQVLLPFIEGFCGFCDHRIRFERFVGNDMLVSVSP